jgi:hypothetical protein
MTPDDFPLMFGMFSKDGGRISPPLPEKYLGWYRTAINKLSPYVGAAEIPNAIFQDLKSTFNGMFEKAWRRLPRPENFYHNPDVPQDVRDNIGDYDYPTLHTFNAVWKKIENTSPCELTTTAIDFLTEIKPIVIAMTDLKTKTVKRQPKTDAEKHAEKYTPPKSSSKAVARVQTILEQLVDREFQNLVTMFTNRYQNMVTRFIEKQAAADLDPTLMGMHKARSWDRNSPMVPNDYYSIVHHCTRNGQVDGYEVAMLAKAIRTNYSKSPYREIVSPQAMQIMADEAEKDAKHVRDLFVVKNLRKFVSILEAKGDDAFVSAEEISTMLNLRGLEGTFRITFNDGSSFDAKNQIVWVMNSHGTQFYRFPLNFQNVKLPGGGKMASPSEKRMNTVFLGK